MLILLCNIDVCVCPCQVIVFKTSEGKGIVIKNVIQSNNCKAKLCTIVVDF